MFQSCLEESSLGSKSKNDWNWDWDEKLQEKPSCRIGGEVKGTPKRNNGKRSPYFWHENDMEGGLKLKLNGNRILLITLQPNANSVFKKKQGLIAMMISLMYS